MRIEAPKVNRHNTLWLVIALCVAVLIVLLDMVFDTPPSPNASVSFAVATDVDAAEYCLDHGYRFFVRASAETAYCMHSDTDGIAEDANRWLIDSGRIR